MANFFDQFDAPAPTAGSGNFFDQFDAAPPPAQRASYSAADLGNMSKEQLLDAYRNLPRDSAIRRQVKKRLVGMTDVPTMNRAQSAVAGATDALSFGLSDEINAGVTSALGGGQYDDLLAANRQQMKMAEESNPGTYALGQVGGGLVQAAATGGGSLTGGLTGLVRGNVLGATTRAVPAATRLGRVAQGAGNVGKVAATAGASGAVYGFNSGEGGLENRLQNAWDVGKTSALVAPVASKAIKSVGQGVNALRGQTPIWSSKEIEEMSQKLYREATQEGATIKPNTMANVGRRMIGLVRGDINYSHDVSNAFTNARQAMDLVERTFVKRAPKPGAAPMAPRPGRGVPAVGPGVNPGSRTFTGTSTPHLQGGSPTSLEDLEVVRRRLSKLAAMSTDDDEARMIYNMRSALDETIAGLTPADLANGSTTAFKRMQEARKLWQVKSNTEWAEDMAHRAQLRAGQYSVSKTENALRTETRAAGSNAKKMRRVGDDIAAAVDKVANPGMVQNAIRELGKWSPLSGIRGPGAMYIAPQFGIPLSGAGLVAQGVSHRMTKKNFRNLQRTIQNGLDAKPIPVSRGERLARRAVPYAIPGLLASTPDGSITAERTRFDEYGNVIN